MASKQCTKDITVKNVQKWVSSQPMHSRYSIHQFFEWFEIDRKIERILWSMLKKSEIIRAKQAEEAIKRKAILEKLEGGFAITAKERKIVIPPEPDPKVGPIIGKCPRCGSDVRGTITKSCKKNAGTFGVSTFYKECTACSYYSEIFEKRGKHTEVEGG